MSFKTSKQSVTEFCSASCCSWCDTDASGRHWHPTVRAAFDELRDCWHMQWLLGGIFPANGDGKSTILKLEDHQYYTGCKTGCTNEMLLFLYLRLCGAPDLVTLIRPMIEIFCSSRALVYRIYSAFFEMYCFMLLYHNLTISNVFFAIYLDEL